MDHAGDGLPLLNQAAADLHLHSTASDGALPPAQVVRRAAGARLQVIALTDHDSVAGLAPAIAAASDLGVTVLSGCELSVLGPVGELHLLMYGFRPDAPGLTSVLQRARDARAERGREIVARLQALGVAIGDEDVVRAADGAPVGRPHVAKALIEREVCRSVNEAFGRFLGRGRPAFVAKSLPDISEMTAFARKIGGVTSAAHLGSRGPKLARRLYEAGVDGLEVMHPSHSPSVQAALERAARSTGLLRTGGSDWHGTDDRSPSHGTIGDIRVPLEWVALLEQRAETRHSA